MAFGAVPAMNVTVSDASGKAAFKGMTDKGVFATAKLEPGNYTVQLASQSGGKGQALHNRRFRGNEEGFSWWVPGEKLARGGVALKVNVGPV